MTTFRIRPAVAEDAAALVRERAVVYPYLVRGVAATRRMIAEPPPGEERLTFVAELCDEVVGAVTAYRTVRAAQPGFGQVSLLHVHPDHRGRGVGDALMAAAGRHLRGIGVRRAGGTAQPAALGFARRHGFEPTRELHYSAVVLDPASPPAEVALPAGLRLAPVRAVRGPALYAADCAATPDEPGDVPGGPVSYEAWRNEVWDDPDLDRDLSTAVLDGATVVCFTLLHRPGRQGGRPAPRRGRRGPDRVHRERRRQPPHAGRQRAARLPPGRPAVVLRRRAPPGVRSHLGMTGERPGAHDVR
jgi:GNAT superfamily N-acetyltransferase